MSRISWSLMALCAVLVQGCPPEEDKPGTGAGNDDAGPGGEVGGGESGGEENGGANDACAGVRCMAGRHCVVTEVQCIKAPCPPLVECVLDDEPGAPGCELIDCRPGDTCVEDASGAGSCVPAGEGVSCGKNTCASGEVCCNESCGICTPPGGACIELYCGDPEPACDLACDKGTHCELVEVQCITTPCDPVPECVDDQVYGCELIDCKPGYTCTEDDTGSGACVPLDACATVRCMAGTHCELVDVTCVKAPCDPVAECVADEECTGPIIDCAAPPPGCNYQGGGCVKGSWTCGKLVCDPCAELDCASCKVVDGKAQCGTPCGDNTCLGGQECCNASCGTCVDPGNACIQLACD